MKTLLLEKKEKVALVTLNQPDKLNVLGSEILADLEHAFSELEKDQAVRVIVITGAGKAFAAGANIKEMRAMSPEQAEAFSRRGQKLFRFIELQPKPVIAAINGFALGGGCELACACDLRTASPNTKIAEPEINLGIIPGWGGSVRLNRLMGLSQTKKMILMGEALTGSKAEQLGLVHWLFDPQALIPETLKIAEQLAEKPPLALAKAKKILNESFDLSIDEGEKMEAHLFADCFKTEDQTEGMNAFLEKRKPNFKGK